MRRKHPKGNGGCVIGTAVRCSLRDGLIVLPTLQVCSIPLFRNSERTLAGAEFLLALGQKDLPTTRFRTLAQFRGQAVERETHDEGPNLTRLRLIQG